MTILVVDDQINVVNGIVSGVDWETAGISKVLHAYNASMAREILECQPVDILVYFSHLSCGFYLRNGGSETGQL